MTISLIKPSVGTVGWGGDVNQNFTSIEGALNASPVIVPGDDPQSWLSDYTTFLQFRDSGDLTGLSSVGSPGMSIDTSGAGWCYKQDVASGSVTNKFYYKAGDSSDNDNEVACKVVLSAIGNGNFAGAGLYCKVHADNELTLFQVLQAGIQCGFCGYGHTQIGVISYNLNTFQATHQQTYITQCGPAIWLKAKRISAATTEFWFSVDGVGWSLLLSLTHTTSPWSTNLNDLGFGYQNSSSAKMGCAFDWVAWKGL